MRGKVSKFDVTCLGNVAADRDPRSPVIASTLHSCTIYLILVQTMLHCLLLW